MQHALCWHQLGKLAIASKPENAALGSNDSQQLNLLQLPHHQPIVITHASNATSWDDSAMEAREVKFFFLKNCHLLLHSHPLHT